MGEGRFAGQVAIVSGGSHGIGRAIAAGFAGEGGQVMVADLAPADYFAGNPQVVGANSKSIHERVILPAEFEPANRLL